MILNRLICLRFVPILLGLLSFQCVLAQSIAIARAQAPGSTVTVRGIVTNGDDLGKIRYLQDASAGIAAFPGTGSVAGFEGAVFPGDSIEVTGTLVDFHGLLEITPITAFQIISSGHPLPLPKPITLAGISETYESQLLEFECITFGNAGGIFNNSGNYTITDSEGASAKVYLRSGHPLLGNSIPDGPIRLVSILSAYDDFQLLPQTSVDIQSETCLFFPQTLVQTNISSTGFQLDWQTSLPANCMLHLGTSPNPDTHLPVNGVATAHGYLFENLAPGTIYWVQVEAEHDGHVIYSETKPFATASTSSGRIKTYFNQGIDPSFANGFVPDGVTQDAVVAETIARIDSAQESIDVAVYNNNRDDITNALIAAHDRGVRIRYVAAEAATNAALDPAPDFKVLYGNEEAIMHHKFLVIDADLPEKSWVMSGSMNWTSQNINTDFNNTIFIQDQSLARTYRLEFEEMWGSSGLIPDPLNSRFGAAKRDNTPHDFVIDGHLVQSYFSPSDQTTTQIERALRTAQSEALFATFSFTKNELGNALVDIHSTGVPVRGIMENINDNGAEYDHLLANGVQVKHHNLTGDLHHKYAVVDAYDLNSDPTVVTGSHNWSVSAETINDENTLVLHHPALAALYKAEFEKRWGAFPSSVENLRRTELQLFPNPSSNWLSIQGLQPEEGVLTLKNALGQCLQVQRTQHTSSFNWNISDLMPGQYYITYTSAHAIASVPFQKI